MPRKRSQSKRKTHRRGSGIMDWIRKGHQTMRKNNMYSKGLSYAYDKYGKQKVGQTLSKSNAALVNRGVSLGLAKLRQQGYGLSRAGNGLRRTGNGLRRTGMGSRMKC